MPDQRNSKAQLSKVFAPLLIIPGLLILIPLIIIRGIPYLFRSAMLHGSAWKTQNPWILFVYSDSAKWKEFAETNIIPHLPPNAMVINRSSPWSKQSSAGKAYLHFGGTHEHCPLGVVIEPWKPAKRFRFFRPFMAARQGDESALLELKETFLVAVKTGR